MRSDVMLQGQEEMEDIKTFITNTSKEISTTQANFGDQFKKALGIGDGKKKRTPTPGSQSPRLPDPAVLCERVM